MKQKLFASILLLLYPSRSLSGRDLGTIILIVTGFLLASCTDCPTQPEIDRTLIEHYIMVDSEDFHLSPNLDEGRIYQILMLNDNKYYTWFVVGVDTPVRYKNFIFADGLVLHGSIEVWLYRIGK